MADAPNMEISKQLAVALIRQAISGLGLLLVKRGLLDPKTADAWLTETATAIVGFLLMGGAIFWQYLKSKFNVLALRAAVKTDPPADTPKEITQAVAEVKATVKAENTVSTI